MSIARTYATLVYLSLGAALPGLAVVLVGEITDTPRMVLVGAWLTVPVTVLMGGAVLLVLSGYVLAGAITLTVWSLAAWRRCRRR